MGFFKKIKDLFKKTKLSKELPEPKKIKIKTKIKKILSDYHHIIKIYWVKENDIIDDSQIEIMIDWIKEHKTRYDINISANNPYEPNLVKMFFKEFKVPLYEMIVTIASEKKIMSEKALFIEAVNLFKQITMGEGSSVGIVIGILKIGKVRKNEI